MKSKEKGKKERLVSQLNLLINPDNPPILPPPGTICQSLYANLHNDSNEGSLTRISAMPTEFEVSCNTID